MSAPQNKPTKAERRAAHEARVAANIARKEANIAHTRRVNQIVAENDIKRWRWLRVWFIVLCMVIVAISISFAAHVMAFFITALIVVAFLTLMTRLFIGPRR